MDALQTISLIFKNNSDIFYLQSEDDNIFIVYNAGTQGKSPDEAILGFNSYIPFNDKVGKLLFFNSNLWERLTPEQFNYFYNKNRTNIYMASHNGTEYVHLYRGLNEVYS